MKPKNSSVSRKSASQDSRFVAATFCGKSSRKKNVLAHFFPRNRLRRWKRGEKAALVKGLQLS